MAQYFILAQIIVSCLVIVLIISQQRGTALGSAFGQEGGFYATRRGVQKKIFWATVGCGVLFIALAVANLLIY